MSPDRARIFIAEDSEAWRDIEKEVLTQDGHEIVVEAKTVSEAISLIPKAVELGVNVGIVDGRIPSDPLDGQRVAAALRKAIPGIKIVGISGDRIQIHGVDAMVDKLAFDSKRLRKIVKEF